MDFLSQVFTFPTYYLMMTNVFQKIGYNYYKGLNNKLPPIRYLGKNINNEDLIIISHPKDFLDNLKYFKNAYYNIKLLTQQFANINLLDKKDEIYEIYPSVEDLNEVPNGFLALFVNEEGMNILLNEFNKNIEIRNLKFIKFDNNLINRLKNINLTNLLNQYINKILNNKFYMNKYYNLYLVIGNINNINFKTGQIICSNKYNLIGGKRRINENCKDSTIRETIEELGLKENSILIKFIKKYIYSTNDIIQFSTFNIYSIYFTPKNVELCKNITNINDI